MAEAQENVVEITPGHNINDIKKQVSEAVENVNQLKKDRSGINADIQAVREKMESLGVKKEAFDMAMRYASWDPDKREGFDIAYDIVREAIGLPFNAQGDFFKDGNE